MLYESVERFSVGLGGARNVDAVEAAQIIAEAAVLLDGQTDAMYEENHSFLAAIGRAIQVILKIESTLLKHRKSVERSIVILEQSPLQQTSFHSSSEL